MTEQFNPARRIGRFLAYLRKDFGIQSQSEFAEKLKISRFYLSNIEAGRTMLKLKTAWDACLLLAVHPDFLISCGKNNRAPFPALEREAMARADALITANRMSNFVDAWAAVRDVLLHNSDAGAESEENEELTNKAYSLTTDGVQPVLPKLIQRQKRATKTRGSKSELATWLGVHRQCVTDWLSGKQEPGGEITLKLLHWVKQRERQTKKP